MRDALLNELKVYVLPLLEAACPDHMGYAAKHWNQIVQILQRHIRLVAELETTRVPAKKLNITIERVSHINKLLSAQNPMLRLRRVENNTIAVIQIDAPMEVPIHAGKTELLKTQELTVQKLINSIDSSHCLTTLMGPKLSGKSTILRGLFDQLNADTAIATGFYTLPTACTIAGFHHILLPNDQRAYEPCESMIRIQQHIRNSVDLLILDCPDSPTHNLITLLHHLIATESCLVILGAIKPLGIEEERVIKVPEIAHAPRDPKTQSSDCDATSEAWQLMSKHWDTRLAIAVRDLDRLDQVVHNHLRQPSSLIRIGRLIQKKYDQSDDFKVVRQFIDYLYEYTSDKDGVDAACLDEAAHSVSPEHLCMLALTPLKFELSTIQSHFGLNEAQASKMINSWHRHGLIHHFLGEYSASEHTRSGISKRYPDCLSTVVSQLVELDPVGILDLGIATPSWDPAHTWEPVFPYLMPDFEARADNRFQTTDYHPINCLFSTLIANGKYAGAFRAAQAGFKNAHTDSKNRYKFARWAATASFYMSELETAHHWVQQCEKFTESEDQEAATLNLSAAISIERNESARLGYEEALRCLSKSLDIYKRQLQEAKTEKESKNARISSDTLAMNCAAMQESLGLLDDSAKSIRLACNSENEELRANALLASVTIHLRMGNTGLSHEKLRQAVKLKPAISPLHISDTIRAWAFVRLADLGYELGPNRLEVVGKSSPEYKKDKFLRIAAQVMLVKSQLSPVFMGRYDRFDLDLILKAMGVIADKGHIRVSMEEYQALIAEITGGSEECD